MALRDKLRDRAQPHLQPGEHIHQVFLAQTGPSPYWIILTYLTLFWNRYYIVVVTDQSVTIIRSKFWKQSPKGPNPVEARLPRRTQIGPLSGLWGQTSALGRKVWIHKRFHRDIETADSALADMATQGADLLPPPGGPMPPPPVAPSP